MANQRIEYASKHYLSLVPCQEVVLCLTDVWADRTVSGNAWVYAQVDNQGRFLGSGGEHFPALFFNPRGLELFQYTFLVDDTQFINDPGTGLPYVLTCADIVEVSPIACLIRKIEALIAALAV